MSFNLKSKGKSKGSKGYFDPCVTLEEFDTKKSMMGMMKKKSIKNQKSKGMMMKKRVLNATMDSEIEQDNDQEVKKNRALGMGSMKSKGMMMKKKGKSGSEDIFVGIKSGKNGKSKGGKGKSASVPVSAPRSTQTMFQMIYGSPSYFHRLDFVLFRSAL